MFRSTDDGDTWTQQNAGFTALDVNSVVINPSGNIFAGVFRSMNDGDQWSDVTSGLLPPGGNVWAVATGGIAYAETVVGGVFRSVRPTSTARVTPTPRPGQRPLRP